MRKEFLVFGQPVIEQDEIDEVVDSLHVKWLGTGPKVARFEKEFAEYVGAKHAVAVNSCTAGLHLSLLASGVGPGDEVITTPMTFCATANVIEHVGARPVFVDVQPDTMNIDPNLIEAAITERTKVILPVHFAGYPCDMERISQIAYKHNLQVIEDAAHAIESVDQGRKVGQISPLTCFSFYVTKNITTGEGGMITTDDPELADRLKIYALHGMDKDAWKRYSDEGFRHYQVVVPGYKYNMMDIQAALGIHQLKKIERFHLRRSEVYRRYSEAFADLPLVCPVDTPAGSVHAYHLFPVLIDSEKTGVTREEMMAHLHERNIGTGIHFVALHRHAYYRERYGFKAEDFPNANFISERTLSLPLSGGLSEADVDDVIEAVRQKLTPTNT